MQKNNLPYNGIGQEFIVKVTYQYHPINYYHFNAIDIIAAYAIVSNALREQGYAYSVPTLEIRYPEVNEVYRVHGSFRVFKV